MKIEKILKIEEEITFKKNDKDSTIFEGFQIVTNLQTIKIGICNDQKCCEDWGYLFTNDDIKDFIGAELKSLSVVDEALNNKRIEELERLDNNDSLDTMFVNLETSEGLLQFVVYNSHNGYYGHKAVLISTQLNLEDFL